MIRASATAPARRPHVGLGLVAALVLAGCAAPPPSGSPEPAPTTAPTPASTPTPVPTPPPTEPPASVPAPPDGSISPAPPGTTWVELREAGIRIPVPDSWEQVPPGDLVDPERRDELERRFPGTAVLLEQADGLGDRAAPVLLAVDPSDASRSGSFATNLSVLATQPSVNGLLLDLAAGFIGDGIATTLGAPPPPRERIELPAGEAVRLELDVPPGEDGQAMTAIAWVIGAPGATVLVTLMGSEETLAGIGPDDLAGAITPLEGGSP